jgi:5-methylcytosine-specific restriction endonuclease McrA
LRICHFFDSNFVSVSADVSCDVSRYRHSADGDSEPENEFCVPNMQLGLAQEFVDVKRPFVFAQSSCDPNEKDDLDQEAIHPEHHEMAVGELPNSRKKTHWNSKGWKIPARKSFSCPTCNRRYCSKVSLMRHLKCECGKEPSWECLYCSYAGLYKASVQNHIKRRHVGMRNIL